MDGTGKGKEDENHICVFELIEAYVYA